jgi:hypothetical protein
MMMVRKLLQRSRTDRCWLVCAIVLHLVIACVRVLMPRGPIWRWLIGERPVRATADRGRSDAESRVIWAVKTATTLVPFGRSCLTEAVTAHWLLSLAGCRSSVRIGIAAAEPTPLAHAWVECDGRTVLGGESVVAYAPLSLRGHR